MKIVIAALLTFALAGTALAATAQPQPVKTAIKVKFTPGVSMF